MEPYIAIFFGLVFGSFLNVCIYRVPRQLSVISPARSYCPNCGTQLLAWENIPVLSWVLLAAKCRSCKKPISGQYPLVEILSAVMAGASVLRFGISLTALIIYALCAALIVITFIDLEFKIIPNVISFPGITLGLCLGILSQYTDILQSPPLTKGAADSLFGLLAGGGFFYVIGHFYYLVAKRVGLGGGDIKLMALTGAVMGLESVAPTIFAGSIVGALVGIVAMIFTGQGRHTEIPFGPWLSLGAVLYIFADLPFLRF